MSSEEVIPEVLFRIRRSSETTLKASEVVTGRVCPFETQAATGNVCAWSGNAPNGGHCQCMVHLPDIATLCCLSYRNDEEKNLVCDCCVPNAWSKLELQVAKKPSGGLSYDVWVTNLEMPTKRALIVFRGTRIQSIGDWFANLRWIRPITSRVLHDHYRQTREIVPQLISALEEKLGQHVVIEAAGHSLGGGLAQQAAYCANKIKTVYAFDSSPVTGYGDIPSTQRRVNAKGVTVFRISQTGEMLAFPRNFLRRFLYEPFRFSSNINPCIAELKFNLPIFGNAIDRHGRHALAVALRDLMRSPETTVNKTLNQCDGSGKT